MRRMALGAWFGTLAVVTCTGPLPAQQLLERLESRLKQRASEPVAEESEELPPPLPRLEGPGPAPRADDQQATLGVRVIDNTAAVRQRYGLAVASGAVIRSIREGGPAAQYGLPIGGAIVAVDGQVVQSADDLVRVLQRYRPGELVELMYYEQDRVGRKKVRLSSGAPAADATVPPAPSAGSSADPEPPLRLGDRFPDRPLLNRLGQVLDDVLPPAAAPRPPAPEPAPATPTAPRAPAAAPGTDRAAEIVELWKQVQALQQQVAALQQRIAELEARQKPGPDR